MRTTTSANMFTSRASDLLTELEFKLTDYDRANEMLTRLNLLDHDAEVPSEISAFVKAYSGIDVSNEGIVSTYKMIKEILIYLKKAIVWIYEKLKEMFLLFMDGTYRTRKEMIDLQRKIIILSTNRGLASKLEKLTTSTVEKKDVETILFKSQYLVELIKSCSGVQAAEHMDVLLSNLQSNAGVEVNDTVLTDSCGEFETKRNITYAQAGWSIDSALDLIKRLITMLTGIQSLKETHKKINNEISALDKKITDAMHQNVSAEAVNDLQHQVSTKMRIAKVIGYSINILLRRTDNVAKIFRAMEQDVSKSIPKDTKINDYVGL